MSSIASSTKFNDRQTSLLKACGKGDEHAVFNVVDDVLWHTQTDKDALRQALQRVCGRGNLRLAQFLIETGAEVNGARGGESPALNQAAKAGHTAIVELLLKHGADPEVRDKATGRTVLFTPVTRGFSATVELLAKTGARVNARDKDGKTVLILLASEKPTKWMNEGRWGIIDLLVKHGADLEKGDHSRRTVLIWAASTGKTELCDHLLSGRCGKTADVKAVTSKGQTALHLACENNHPETLEVLLRYGADPAARSDGRWTALHLAAQKGHARIVSLLLDQGDRTPVNAQLSHGMAPLHWAAGNGHEEVVRLLLNHKRTINGVTEYVTKLSIKDTDDRTPLLCAAENGHSSIVNILCPSGTAERLPLLEREACEKLSTTVVDFGDFRDGKTLLVNKDHNVYDLLYGWDHAKNKPTVPTHLKDVRRQSNFRWIHLPANNIAWIEALLAKTFVEGGCKDIENFKALEKCFNQAHRGAEAHAHFMRTWSQRYDLAPLKETMERSKGASDATAGADPPAINGDAHIPKVFVSDGEINDGTPASPATPGLGRKPNSSQDEGPGSDRKKRKKSKGQAIEERHGRTPKRRNGPPGDPGAKKKFRAEKPRDDPAKPGSNGKIVLFMPYLHYESDGRRKKMAAAIERAKRGLGPEQIGRPRCAEDILIEAYLKHDPPIHVRRTLDQYFYHSMDTSQRDVDQVVYRHFKRNLKHEEPMIFMVDQLWLFILGKELVVTSFPQRWDLPPTEDPLNVLLGIIEDISPKSRAPIESVYELAMIITGRCCGVFDRHRLENECYQFLDMFEMAIGKITDRETQLFNEFRSASAATHFFEDPSRSRRYPEGRATEQARDRQLLTDISVETLLLAEIKDIQDELTIIAIVLQNQGNILPEAAENIMRELGGNKSPAATEIERKQKEQLKILQVHVRDIERMRSQTKQIYTSLTNLLDLKQKHANAFEARFASDQAALTASQGQTILVFTIVTIFFLPMSFIAAFFAINVHDFGDLDGGKGLNLRYVSKYIFGIGLSISVPLVVVALSFDDMHRSWRLFQRRRNGALDGIPGAQGGRQLSDLDNKVQAFLERTRASSRPSEPRQQASGRSLEGYYAEELAEARQHITWERGEVEEKNGVRHRRRESKASVWSRPRLSLERAAWRPGSGERERKKSLAGDDLESGFPRWSSG